MPGSSNQESDEEVGPSKPSTNQGDAGGGGGEGGVGSRSKGGGGGATRRGCMMPMLPAGVDLAKLKARAMHCRFYFRVFQSVFNVFVSRVLTQLAYAEFFLKKICARSRQRRRRWTGSGWQ
jgi:hypothetical protein